MSGESLIVAQTPKTGKARKQRRKLAEKNAHLADQLEAQIEKAADPDATIERSGDCSDQSGLDHIEQLALVQQAIQGRWLTEESAETLDNADLRTASARTVAMRTVMDSMTSGDPQIKMAAVRLLTVMEQQNQRDQLAAVESRRSPLASDAAGEVQVNVQIVNDLRRELLDADDVLEAARTQALEEDAVLEIPAPPMNGNGHANGNGNGHGNGHTNGNGNGRSPI